MAWANVVQTKGLGQALCSGAAGRHEHGACSAKILRCVKQFTRIFGSPEILLEHRLSNPGSIHAMVDRVRGACEACFDAHSGDCSGFVRAVSSRLGVQMYGLADQIVDTIRDKNAWRQLPNGVAAAQRAAEGKLVIGGLKGSEQSNPDPHGHVVVVVTGPLAHDAYPSAYWGKLGGVGAKNKTTNWAWRAEDRDRVSYAEHDI
jgi:hypothetical protein